MPIKRPDLAAFALAAVVVAAATILLALGAGVPSWFSYIAVGAVSGGAGLAAPVPLFTPPVLAPPAPPPPAPPQVPT